VLTWTVPVEGSVTGTTMKGASCTIQATWLRELPAVEANLAHQEPRGVFRATLPVGERRSPAPVWQGNRASNQLINLTRALAATGHNYSGQDAVVGGLDETD